MSPDTLASAVIPDPAGSATVADAPSSKTPRARSAGQRGSDDALDDALEGMLQHDAQLELDPVPSFEEVATLYGPTIYSIAYRLTGDDEEARDLAQDVFVRVYRNLDKYEPGTFSGWLYRVTKNLFLDRVRRRKRIRFEGLPDEDHRHPVETAPGPAERLDQGLIRGDIEQALLQVPPTFRTAVVLCDVQGLSYEEIAQATGWPLGTVRSRIHRGRKLLRDALAPEPDTDA